MSRKSKKTLKSETPLAVGVRDPSHMTPEPVASQPNFIVQPLVTEEWTF